MPVTISSFGGVAGWMARKIAPSLASRAYTALTFAMRRKPSRAYIQSFLSHGAAGPNPLPLLISIETINRCNGSCSFCPCNIRDEQRPFKLMPEDVFFAVAEQLTAWQYRGRVFMNANNEPFMDKRIIELTRHMREKLPNAQICMITNGTLLTLEKFLKIAPFLDDININNYSDKMLLHPNAKSIARYVKSHPDEFRHLSVDIQYRYVNEVLSNRNGTAPNKQSTAHAVIHEPCLEPFTSMIILPDGTAGLCCFDALEKTNIGNCMQQTLEQIWNSPSLHGIRKLMREDRAGYAFCKGCDGFSKKIRAKGTRNGREGEAQT
jgi:MoaA/NifB/PqqE/SkfB family radical SAM enzyme